MSIGPLFKGRALLAGGLQVFIRIIALETGEEGVLLNRGTSNVSTIYGVAS